MCKTTRNLSNSIAPMYVYEQAYSVGDVVMDHGIRYVCVAPVPSGVSPFTTSDFWSTYFNVESVQEALDGLSGGVKQTISSRSDTSISSISFANAVPIVRYTSLSQAQFANLALSCADAATLGDGVYTWELMLSDDVDITSMSFAANVAYVGNDTSYNPSHSFDRIDTSRTTHVFSVRLIRVSNVDKWQISYAYSFKD